MKKYEKYLILVLLFISFIAILLFTFLKTREDEEGNPNKLIATYYYANYAWGYTFNGIAIFDDGSIYSWNVGDDFRVDYNIDYIPNEYDSLKDFVSKYAKKEATFVSDSDLKQMRKYLKLIDEDSSNFDSVNYMNDYGEKTIYVYKNEEKYLLYEYGDYTGISSDSNAQKLIDIIMKYGENNRNITKDIDNGDNNSRENDDNNLIASMYSENFSWGNNYWGMGVFKDGSIYIWDNDDGIQKDYLTHLSDYNNEEFESFILKYGHKQDILINDQDLKQIKDYISDVVNNDIVLLEDDREMADAGHTYIYIFNNNKKYLIKESGNNNKRSDDSRIQEIVNIIIEYKNKIASMLNENN